MSAERPSVASSSRMDSLCPIPDVPSRSLTKHTRRLKQTLKLCTYPLFWEGHLRFAEYRYVAFSSSSLGLIQIIAIYFLYFPRTRPPIVFSYYYWKHGLSKHVLLIFFMSGNPTCFYSDTLKHKLINLMPLFVFIWINIPNSRTK